MKKYNKNNNINNKKKTIFQLYIIGEKIKYLKV